MKEYILCADLNYNGVIVCGYRHGDCYEIIRKLTGDNEGPGREDQGFLTSLNRFVCRREAWIIAKESNQIKYGLIASTAEDEDESTLISENLYYNEKEDD